MINQVVRDTVKALPGFAGWAVTTGGHAAYPVFNTDGRATLRAALLGGSLSSEVKQDLVLLLDAQKEDIRLAWDAERDALVTSFNGGSPAPLPNYDTTDVAIDDMVEWAIAQFDLVVYRTFTKVGGAQVQPTNSEADLAKQAGFVIVCMHNKSLGSPSLDSVIIAGVSRLNYHGTYFREGGAANVWIRNSAFNANDRAFLDGVADRTFANWPALFGMATPTAGSLPYDVTTWGDTVNASFHLERNGRRPTLQSNLRVYGMPVIPAHETFTLVADADLQNQAAGYGSLIGTWDVPMSAIRTAGIQAATDARTVADTSAAERLAAKEAAESLSDDGSIWRLTVTQPFTVPMVGVWHSDLAQLGNDEVFIPQFSWTRRKWDNHFAGKQQSLFAAMIMQSSTEGDYLGTVESGSVVIKRDKVLVALSDVPQYSTIVTASETVASAVEAYLASESRDDIVVVTETANVTAEIGNVPLFEYVPASKSSAERFIALKADVRATNAERMLLSTIWAANQAGKRFFG